MNTLSLQQPPRIEFGNGCATQCAELLAGRRPRGVLVITSSPVLPTLAPLLAALRATVPRLTVYDRIDAEPTLAMFADALRLAESLQLDAVIGAGGGSAMDVAKLVAALAGRDQQIADVFGLGRLTGRNLFLACLPTTSGTGSEVSPNAILLDESDGLKKGIVSPYLVPDLAGVDPLLTVSLPAPVTAATGLDALVHCVEAYANKFAHPIVDLYALQGVRLIGANLLRAVRRGDDLEARANLALGSLYGGLCLGPVNTAAVHALAYPLGGEFHVPHGVSNAVLLPHVLEFNLPAAVDRYADIAQALGVPPAAAPEETARRGIARLRELARDGGIPSGLAALGIPSTAIPRLARAALTVTRLLKNNPRELTEADAARIYAAAQ
jgi:alcohol dehydrogenase